MFNGLYPARDVRLTVELPASVVYLNDNAMCIEGPTSTLTCDLGLLRIRERTEFEITVLIDEDVVVNAHEAGD